MSEWRVFVRHALCVTAASPRLGCLILKRQRCLNMPQTNNLRAHIHTASPAQLSLKGNPRGRHRSVACNERG